MARQAEIARRFAAEAGKPGARLLRAQSGSILVSPFDERNLLSWGTHFVLARIMPGDAGPTAIPTPSAQPGIRASSVTPASAPGCRC
jgi:hypothetical protein